MENLSRGYCVICNRTRKLKNISDHLNSGRNSAYSDLIYRCFFIQFLDHHYAKKNKICRRCIADLNFCCNFRFKIEKAHQRLYHIVQLKANSKNKSNQLKEETVDKYDLMNEEMDDISTDEQKSDKTEFIMSLKNAGVVVKEELEDKKTIHIVNDDVNYTDPYGDGECYYDSDASDSDWSTNTDDILISTGYWNEVQKCNRETKTPYIPPKLPKDCTQCPLCEEHIDDKIKLQHHYKKHNLSIFLCDICGRLFPQKFAFDGHMSKHNNEKFPCSKCDKVYISKSGLFFHIKQVHLKMKMYKCRKCKMTFSEWSQRHKHLNEIHGFHEEYSCEQCGKSFKRINKLNCHIRRFHLRERNRVCEYCSARFFSKVELSKHILKHTGAKNHHCQYCGKAFGHRQYLSEHLKIHLNIKKFKCDQCGKAFVQKCSLLGHIRTHHKM